MISVCGMVQLCIYIQRSWQTEENLTVIMNTSEEFFATFQLTPTNQFFVEIFISNIIESILALHDGQTCLHEDLINPNDVIKHVVSSVFSMVSWFTKKFKKYSMFTIFFCLWTRIDLVSDINGRAKGNIFGKTSFCKLPTDISSSYGSDSSHSHVNCYS